VRQIKEIMKKISALLYIERKVLNGSYSERKGLLRKIKMPSKRLIAAVLVN